MVEEGAKEEEDVGGSEERRMTVETTVGTGVRTPFERMEVVIEVVMVVRDSEEDWTDSEEDEADSEEDWADNEEEDWAATPAARRRGTSLMVGRKTIPINNSSLLELSKPDCRYTNLPQNSLHPRPGRLRHRLFLFHHRHHRPMPAKSPDPAGNMQVRIN